MKFSTIDGIDWETTYSDTYCTMVREITARFNQIEWHILNGGAGGGLLSCSMFGIPKPPPLPSEPWLRYYVEDTNLPAEDIISNEGWISVQDVIDAGFNIPLAYAKAITSN